MAGANGGMMGSIMNMFNARGNGDASAAPNISAKGPTNQNPTQQNQPSGDGSIIPNDGKPKAPSDPLAAFDKIFDNTPDDKAPKRPEFKLSPEVLKQAADSQDFGSLVPQDFYERLEKRDPTLFADLFNSIGRKAYSTSLEHSSALTDRFVDLHSQHSQKGLGKHVTATLAKNNLKSISEKSPVAAKQIEQLQQQILDKFPDATPEFIQEQTEEYFRQIAMVMFPDLAEMDPRKKAQRDDPNQLKGDTNWDDWLSK